MFSRELVIIGMSMHVSFPNQYNVKIPKKKFQKISPFLNLRDSFFRPPFNFRVTQKITNWSVLSYETKNTFEPKSSDVKMLLYLLKE